MAFALNSRARLPLSRERSSVTRRQDSLHVTDRPVASPKGAFDTGLRRHAFPPTPPACYPPPWRLPGPDFHRQADASLCSDQVNRSTTAKPWAHKMRLADIVDVENRD